MSAALACYKLSLVSFLSLQAMGNEGKSVQSSLTILFWAPNLIHLPALHTLCSQLSGARRESRA